MRGVTEAKVRADPLAVTAFSAAVVTYLNFPTLTQTSIRILSLQPYAVPLSVAGSQRSHLSGSSSGGVQILFCLSFVAGRTGAFRTSLGGYRATSSKIRDIQTLSGSPTSASQVFNGILTASAVEYNATSLLAAYSSPSDPIVVGNLTYPFTLRSGRPSSQPSTYPSRQPAVGPSSQPSRQPRRHPTLQPSRTPSSQPSSRPTRTYLSVFTTTMQQIQSLYVPTDSYLTSLYSSLRVGNLTYYQDCDRWTIFLSKILPSQLSGKTALSVSFLQANSSTLTLTSSQVSVRVLTCSSASAAASVLQALSSSMGGLSGPLSVSCDGHVWTIRDCSTGSGQRAVCVDCPDPCSPDLVSGRPKQIPALNPCTLLGQGEGSGRRLGQGDYGSASGSVSLLWASFQRDQSDFGTVLAALLGLVGAALAPFLLGQVRDRARDRRMKKDKERKEQLQKRSDRERQWDREEDGHGMSHPDPPLKLSLVHPSPSQASHSHSSVRRSHPSLSPRSPARSHGRTDQLDHLLQGTYFFRSSNSVGQVWTHLWRDLLLVRPFLSLFGDRGTTGSGSGPGSGQQHRGDRGGTLLDLLLLLTRIIALTFVFTLTYFNAFPPDDGSCSHRGQTDCERGDPYLHLFAVQRCQWVGVQVGVTPQGEGPTQTPCVWTDSQNAALVADLWIFSLFLGLPLRALLTRYTLLDLTLTFSSPSSRRPALTYLGLDLSPGEILAALWEQLLWALSALYTVTLTLLRAVRGAVGGSWGRGRVRASGNADRPFSPFDSLRIVVGDRPLSPRTTSVLPVPPSTPFQEGRADSFPSRILSQPPRYSLDGKHRTLT